jgi:hypothetical protein
MYSGGPSSCGVMPWIITGVSKPATCIVMIRMSMQMDQQPFSTTPIYTARLLPVYPSIALGTTHATYPRY